MRLPRFVRIAAIVVLTFLVATFSYALVHRFFIQPPVEFYRGEGEDAVGMNAIQLQILNATNTQGIARRTTEYLRKRGFDVVQVKNANMQSLQSFVIRCTGDSASAARVAYALGIEERHIRTEIDTNLMLDCTVVIGDDYGVLRPFK